MKKAARVIVEKDEYIILIKRRKKVNGSVREYYVIPGGTLDENETFEEAAVREIKEELNVDIELEDMFYEEYNEELEKQEKYFFSKIIKGKISEGSGEEFQNQDINSKYGTYEIFYIRKSEISAYNILPTTIKDVLVGIYA